MSRAGRALALSGIGLAHALALTVPFLTWRTRDLFAFAVLLVSGCFAVAVALHRYFAHRSFRTSRAFQLALGGLAALFFGDPLGFAGKHRLHHRHADTDRDPHSPHQGVWRCWIGHLLDEGYADDAIVAAAPDLAAYPELRWLHRHYYLPGTAVAALLLVAGGYSMLATYALAWCLLAIHAPALVNYFCHRGHNRRFDTPDGSTNNWLLAAVFWGEGWHNNHHHFPGAAHSGLRWYEVDLAFYAIKVLSWLGLVWDLRIARETPRAVPAEGAPCASR
jgi:stearoyl-CoA desaturase (delta-9 desaturase)